MATTSDRLTGDALLRGVNAELVALHERFHHRRPTTARTQLLGDDLLACVMGGVASDVERTMITLGDAPGVHAVRTAFHDAMATTFVELVERLSGREVLLFTSGGHVSPDLEVELFFLAS